MTRLENAINEVKNARVGKNRPWIFDENGNIIDNAIVGEVLYVLDELKDYEVDVDDTTLEFLLDNATKYDNTYNWGANISNDINYSVYNNEDGWYYVLEVHLGGDIRGNYSESFVVKFDHEDDFFLLESLYQYKEINERYSADINLFSDLYSVFDCEIGDTVGDYYEVEKDDLLREIKERG